MTGALIMPIDPRMVKWDEESPAKVDPRMVAWDGQALPKPSVKPYQFKNPLIPSLMSVGQGATFGWGDEILGKLGLVDADRYRATVEQHNKEYPVSSTMGQLGAGVLLPFGAGVKAGMTPLASAMTAGGAATALQMAGDAKQGEAINEASKGALLGAALGPALMGAMKPVGSIGDAIVGQVSRLPLVGDDIASKLAQRRVAESFSRDMVDLPNVSGRMSELGPEARLVDAGGKDTRSMLDVTAVMPGQTGDKVERAIAERIQGRTGRLNEMADIAEGGYGKAIDVLDSLVTQKKTASAPLYQKVHKLTIKPTTDLSSTVQAALDVGVGANAQRIARLNEAQFTLTDPTQPMSMRDLDHLKQGIDDFITKNTKEGRMNAEAMAANGLRTRLLKQLDFLTANKYKQARDAFAGPAALEDALNSGMRFMTQDGVKLERSLSAMSDSEREAFKIGAAQGLRTKIGTGGGATELINSTRGTNDNLKEKLRLMYGDEVNFEKALKILQREGDLKKFERIGQGSQTAGRQFAAQDMDAAVATDAGDLLANAATGNWFNTLKSLASGKSVRDSSLGTPEPVRNAIGDLLLGRPSQTDLEALRLVQEAARRRGAGAAALYGSGSAQASGLLSQ